MKTTLLSLILATAFTSAAVAAPVTGKGDPVLTGTVTVVNFDALGNSWVPSLTAGNLSISGIDGSISTSTTYAGSYNTRGAAYVDNAQGNTNGLRFDFANSVSAFAFNWGASDVNWTLTAYDSTGVALESTSVNAVWGSNDGDYFGLAHAGIAYAELISGGWGDYVMVDNFSFVEEAVAAVPEPGTLALFGLALAGLALGRKRKQAH